MFADPAVVMINAVNINFPRIGSDSRSSTYQSSDGLRTFSISGSSTKNRSRSVLRLDSRKLETDPFVLSMTRPTSMSAYLVVDTPVDGFYSVPANAQLETTGIVNFANSANLLRILAGER